MDNIELKLIKKYIDKKSFPTDISDKADINSPSFTGVPTAPTATAGTDTTQIATTAFVNTATSGKENSSNKVTSLSSNSTDTQYPSAKAVYDYIDSEITSIADAIAAL